MQQPAAAMMNLMRRDACCCTEAATAGGAGRLLTGVCREVNAENQRRRGGAVTWAQLEPRGVLCAVLWRWQLLAWR
jgi:hypothetical protein